MPQGLNTDYRQLDFGVRTKRARVDDAVVRLDAFCALGKRRDDCAETWASAGKVAGYRFSGSPVFTTPAPKAFGSGSQVAWDDCGRPKLAWETY